MFLFRHHPWAASNGFSSGQSTAKLFFFFFTLLRFVAIGMSPDVDQKVCLWEYKQGWDSKAISQRGSSWTAKAINNFVAEVSERMAGRRIQRSGLTLYYLVQNQIYLD